ncbi:hypothetical protein H4R35_007468 [Dimargaris xerosporica]|nr:hypothetical protein H4R35_007468 [Dimargaris xerosporica]
MGGTVWQYNHGQWEQDDATTAYGNFEAALSPKDPESAASVHRVHRRMVMTPIAERLDTLKNFNELIVVLADTMACHGKLHSDCNILHRDISTNNIMVVRHDGRLRGMLIDFDNAIHDEAQSTPGRPERTGTLPFMSIGNLENNDTKRTALDDWESLLYVICWLGTYGLDEKARAGSMKRGTPKLEIQRWLEGTMVDVADAKRLVMDTVTSFSQISKHFLPRDADEDIIDLRQLTANSGDEFDPLKKRVDYEKCITDKCQKILKDAALEAQTALLTLS